MPERMSEQPSDRKPERMSEYLPERMPGYINIYIYMPYILPHGMSETIYVRIVCQGEDHSNKEI